MKLAVSTYSLGRWQRDQGKSVEHCLQWIADVGVSGVEFISLGAQVEKIGPIRTAARLRRRCEKLGLTPCGYCVGANLLIAPKRQRELVERLKGSVDAAAELGVPSMRHDVAGGWQDAKGVRGPKTFANAVKVIKPAIREVADYAQTKGVITTFENHGFYMQAATRVQKLLDAVDHPNFRLTIDMGNFLCVNDDPVAAVRRLTPYMVMAHVKDFHVKPKKIAPAEGWFHTPTPIALRGAMVGHGDIDVPAQLRILKRARYRGFLSLEFEGMEEPTAAITHGLNYLRTHLSAIGGLDEG